MKILLTILLGLLMCGAMFAADFDGDGKDDLAVFRPSTATWWVLKSSNGTYFSVTPTGITGYQTGDIHLEADVNGDGKADFIFYAPGGYSYGNFRVYYSNGNGTTGANSLTFRNGYNDTPIMLDFNGNHKKDFCTFSSAGDWYCDDLSNNDYFYGVHWGTTGDDPIQ